MWQEHRDEELMVFDWDKAARLINEHKPSVVAAGLAGDWEYTGGTIYQEGHSVPADKTDVYLASTWATPEIEMDGEVQDCFRMQSETQGWDEDTYWPASARAILGEVK
jgi:hypothetical protein